MNSKLTIRPKRTVNQEQMARDHFARMTELKNLREEKEKVVFENLRESLNDKKLRAKYWIDK